MKPYLIVNPTSAAGRTGKHFDVIARAVQSAAGEFEHAFTTGPGDATRLAREAARAGKELVVAVGGDGTAGEVVDGLFENGKPLREGIAFGLIPRGTGGDLRKTVGWSTDLAVAAAALAGSATRIADVGKVECTGHGGKPLVRHFINIADAGIGGVVVETVNSSSKALGGKLSFMIGSARGLLKYSDQPIRFRFDGGAWQEDSLTALCVCNGQYFGGGMWAAPAAKMDDGLFDITIWKGMGFVDFALKSKTLYDGTHVKMAKTRTLQAREVEAEPMRGARVLLDVDGEQPGMLPARFTILPGALRLKVAG